MVFQEEYVHESLTKLPIWSNTKQIKHTKVTCVFHRGDRSKIYLENSPFETVKYRIQNTQKSFLSRTVPVVLVLPVTWLDPTDNRWAVTGRRHDNKSQLFTRSLACQALHRAVAGVPQGASLMRDINRNHYLEKRWTGLELRNETYSRLESVLRSE